MTKRLRLACLIAGACAVLAVAAGVYWVERQIDFADLLREQKR